MMLYKSTYKSNCLNTFTFCYQAEKYVALVAEK